jgi:hypothetical protein
MKQQGRPPAPTGGAGIAGPDPACGCRLVTLSNENGPSRSRPSPDLHPPADTALRAAHGRPSADPAPIGNRLVRRVGPTGRSGRRDCEAV